MWLERTPPVHVVDNGIFAPPVLSPDRTSAAVSPSVEIQNEAKSTSGAVTVSATLYDPEGAVVGTTSNASGGLSARAGR